MSDYMYIGNGKSPVKTLIMPKKRQDINNQLTT